MPFIRGKNLIPKTNDPSKDRVFTPISLAQKIVSHFKPAGRCLEPCAGEFAFVNALTDYCGIKNVDWMEIDAGKDFLAAKIEEKYDYLITNPPYSILRKFLIKSMEVSENVIFLCPVNAITGLKARREDIKKAGFFVREICEVDKPKEWASSGFQYAAIHLSKEEGECKITKL